jgi:hypothetical protein
MTRNTMIRWIGIACLLAVGTFAVLPATAESTPERYLELLRGDVRAAKIEILTESLELSDAEASAFWPIYRQYDTELAALGDRRLALVKRFAASYGAMSDEEAEGLVQEWFRLHNDRLKLRKKYFKRVAKEVSAVRAGQFVQVENLLGMLIDIQVAAELPLIE